ncbi:MULTISPECIES: CocE/NonD family hydrolase [unclassified Amycolatopsis]|uniref:CocE/NonD family hydrolase n=1 Tax=unclassified Amycolatopsis TaxID=2618356 RepID=UPI0028771C0E|nr:MULTISPECIES: CocE/NonD family hydrolase [unclassified Amycolatopsis]MDS0134605.1 CocE/NonD family hydrolase [Amycolatopsis sp. 505]MDS0147496.1 CocE/NonD family hydrolase [Amycolatopsis sp. CM201R]
MTFTVEVDVPVPMRDGVALATNVWLPDGPGPFPALLVRTPYGKDDAGLYGNPKLPDVFALVEAGYAVVAQDVRGTSRSPGTFVPHTHEGPDSVDTLAWLAAQPWCDGAVGMWGGSYMGFSQWQAAARNVPALRAIAPVMTSADPYAAPWRSPGGALSQDAVLTWGTLSALRNLRRGLDGDAGALLSGLSDPRSLHEPLPIADRAAVTRSLPWLGDVLAHPERDAFWREIAATDQCERITVPALHIGGWYDVFVGETVRSYRMLRRRAGSAAARDGQRLIIGPWSHPDGTDLGTYPDRSFGLAGSIKTAGVTEAHLRFFDRWVRDRELPEDTHRVRIFVMGTDEWRDEPDWPLPDTRYTGFFLDGGGRANTAAGDGVLASDAPAENATDTFRYDPRDPVPSLGGTVLAAAPGTYPGPADQAAAEAREDVLCFTTPVLERPIEVIGHITLVLHIRSSTPDTDFTGKLVDVHPDGRAILLCEGIQRVRYRESLTEPVLLAPGTDAELTLDLGVTANVFRPGHRIRIEVAGSNFPRYDRNTNTGATIATDGPDDVVVAVNHVHHGPAHPSRLVLPVVERP